MNATKHLFTSVLQSRYSQTVRYVDLFSELCRSPVHAALISGVHGF